MKMFLFLALSLFSSLVMADAAIFSGSDVKILKPSLDFNGKTKILSGNADPTVTATNAPRGALYLNNNTAKYYRKLDSGSTTNWVLLGSLHPPKNALANPDFEISTASWSASGGSFSRTTTSGQFAFGIAGALWDSSAASQALTSDAISLSGKYEGLKGQNGVAFCRIKAASSGATHKIRVKTGSGTLSERSIYAPTDNFQRNSINFVWPSSGSAAIELESVAADEPALYVDDCELGIADNLMEFSQAELVGEAIWPAATNCAWSRTANNDLSADFAADSDCAFPSGSNLRGRAKAPSTKVPAIAFDYLEPGYYLFVAQGFFWKQNTSPNSCSFTVADGLTTLGSGTNTVYAGGAESATAVITDSWVYTTARTNVEFRIRASGQNGSEVCSIYNDSLSQLAIKVYRYPLSTQTAYKPDEISWRIDANIGGSNFDLGNSNQASWVEMTNSSMVLTPAPGSAPVGNACQSGNASTVGTTTCAAGQESNGITFNIPKAGAYKACVEFQHDISNSGTSTAGATFQVVETSSSSSTIIQEGKSRVQDFNNDVSTNIYFPYNLCGTFEFSSAGQKTLRLVYEQLVTNTPTENLVVADQNGSLGQRDIHWTVEPINMHTPAPMFVGSVLSPSAGVENVARVTTSFCNSSPCTIFSQNGGVSSVTRSGTGTYVVNFLPGIFSNYPTCTCSTISSTNNSWCQGFVTPTSFTAATLSNSSTTVDEGIHVICMGPK